MKVPRHLPAATDSSRREGSVDMEMLVGSILLMGVILSTALLASGVAWHWFTTRNFTITYSLNGIRFPQLLIGSISALFTGRITTELLAGLGLALLMMTPYLRVLVSFLYFALVERNWKYALFTVFVLSVLTYSLFSH